MYLEYEVSSLQCILIPLKSASQSTVMVSYGCGPSQDSDA